MSETKLEDTMSETKLEDPLLAILDDLPEDHLPEPLTLTPEQRAELAHLEERDRQRQREWEAVAAALRNNSLAVGRAMRRFRHEGEEQQVERVSSSLADGSFLIDRLGASGAVDQDLAVVLLEFRRRLLEEYGSGPAEMMLIDRAVAAYQDFIRITGWVGNLALVIEHEFFGARGPSAHFQDRYGHEGRAIRGLTVEQHLVRLRENLLPLVERCGRVMREALASLEVLSAAPSKTVERSRPVSISVLFEARRT